MVLLAPHGTGQGIDLPYPGPHVDPQVIPRPGTDDHPVDPGVDDNPAAHGAGGGVVEEGAVSGLPAGQIEGGAQGVPPGGGDDGVHLRVDRAAQLIPLAGGDVHGLPGAVAQVHAVLPPPGRAVVAGGDDLVVFYNYGTVGQNKIDKIVGSYTYDNMIIPSIRFVTNDRLAAFGDTKVILYEGTQKPAVIKEIKCSGNVRSIYYDDAYFGLVYDNKKSAKGYVTNIYNLKGKLVLTQEFDLDYTQIGFLQNGLLCIRNEKSVQLYTMRGSKRFSYTFDRSIYDVISGSGELDYWLILSGETDRIRLKDKF